MDLDTLIAQWTGKAPPGFVPHAVIRQEPPRCVQPRCKRPASLKSDGEYAKSCEPCRIRRAKSCKRRRVVLVDYVSYYTPTVPFVARLDVRGRRSAYGTPGCLVGSGSGISYRW